MPHLPAWLVKLFEVLDRANLPLLASALTFDALLAIIPFAILLIAGLGFLLSQTQTFGDADPSALLSRFLPEHSHALGDDPFLMVERIIEKIRGYRSHLTLFAVPTFLWFSTRLFASVRACLSSVFQVRQRPAPGGFVVSYLLGYVFGKVRDLAMVGFVLALALVNTVLSAALVLFGSERVYLTPPWTFFVTGLGQILGELLTFATGLALFVALYRYASPKRLAWSGALLAGAVATVGFEAAKRLFGLYLRYLAHGGQYSLDANVGAALLVVLWIWYMSLVFLIGAAAADVWDRMHARVTPHGTVPPHP